MQVVILAAGRGTRMGSLTDSVPKPMLKVGDKNLIEHKLDALPPEVDEVILVVGYLADVIRNYFGDSFGGRTIKYVYQDKLMGTAHSLWQAKDLLRGRFLVLAGDDIYNAQDIAKVLEVPSWVMMFANVPNLYCGGRAVIDDQGHLVDIIEGADHGGQPGLVYTSLCLLTTDIFQTEPVKLPDKEEYGLPQTILNFKETRPIKAILATDWRQITAPEDLHPVVNFDITTS